MATGLLNPLLGPELTPPAVGRLGEIRAPTLVLVGSRDVPDIQAIVQRIETDVPHVRKVGSPTCRGRRSVARQDLAISGY